MLNNYFSFEGGIEKIDKIFDFMCQSIVWKVLCEGMFFNPIF